MTPMIVEISIAGVLFFAALGLMIFRVIRCNKTRRMPDVVVATFTILMFFFIAGASGTAIGQILSLNDVKIPFL